MKGRAKHNVIGIVGTLPFMLAGWHFVATAVFKAFLVVD